MKDELPSPKGLKNEWSMLLEMFLDEEETNRSKLEKKLKTNEISLDEIQAAKKDFSNKRKILNQTIENIKTKIEEAQTVIENLELVGSNTEEVMAEIDNLSFEGEKYFADVQSIDQKIKKLHLLQDLIV